MSLFNIKKIDDVQQRTNTVFASYDYSTVSRAMEGKILRDVAEELASKIAEEMYDDILKFVKKDTIVREVSLKVSENILDKMFGEKAK